MKRFLLYMASVIVAAVVCSCSDSAVKDEGEVVSIDMSGLQDIPTADLFGDRVFSDVEFIPLETNERCLLGNIVKVIGRDSVLYVLAQYGKSSDRQLHMFGMDGHHIAQISNKGGGPGEYLRLGSFTIAGDTLYLLEDYGAQIKMYTLDGRYQGVESAQSQSFGIVDIAPLGDSGDVLIATDITHYSPNIYTVINPPRDSVERVLVEHPFGRDESFAEPVVVGHISNWSDTAKLVIMPFSTTLYQLHNVTHELSPCIRIMTEHPLPSISAGMSMGDYKKLLGKSNASMERPVAAYRSGDWLVVNFFSGGVIWNIRDNSGYRTKNGIGSGVIECFPFYTTNIAACGNDGVICWFDAEEILRMREQASEETLFMPSEEICATLDEDSNPVLVRYHFK